MNGNETRSLGRVLRMLAALTASVAVGVAIAGAVPAAPPPGHGPPGGGHDEATEEYVAPAALYGIGADGTGLVRKTQGPEYNAWTDNSPHVRAGDGAIVFSSTRPAADESTDAELWMLEADGTLTQLTDNTTAVSDETGAEEPINDLNPVFSPDGTKVAYQSAPAATEEEEEGGGSPGGAPAGSGQAGSQIWVLDLATLETEQMTTIKASVGAAKQPTWSPDGTKIAFTLGDGTPTHLAVVDLATKAVTDLTAEGGTHSMAAWNPVDANVVAFTRGLGMAMDVVARELDTGRTYLLAATGEMESEPTWSPDGTRIAYQRGDESLGASIWLMDADGTDQHAVTTATAWSDRDPAFSPDGTLVFESTADAVPAADLRLAKTGVPAAAVTGQIVTYTVSVVNGGPLTATDVVLVDTVPTGMEIVSATAVVAASEHGEEEAEAFTPVVTVAGQVVTAELGDLAKSERGAVVATLTIVVKATTAGTFANTATITLDPGETDLIDPISSNDVATAVTVVTAYPTPGPGPGPAPEPPGPPLIAPAPFQPPAYGGQRCTIFGTPGNDVLTGTAGRDVICGLGGNDVITGLAGNDLIVGGPGNDRIVGGAGNDVLNGQDGNDTVDGTTGNDILYGGAGDDRLTHTSGKDKLYAGAGNDTLFARDGAYDWVNGGTGRDTATIDVRVDRTFSIEVAR